MSSAFEKRFKETSKTSSGDMTHAGEMPEVPMLRLPSGFVMLSRDNVSNGRVFEGTVGIKYGPEKGDWLRLSYMDMRKLIEFCTEHRELFNAQLSNERSKMNIGDL